MSEALHALWSGFPDNVIAWVLAAQAAALAWWAGLPAATQDAALFAALLAPAVLIGLVLTAGFRPFGLVGAMLWRFRWTNLLFVVLIAASIGIGVGLIAQERGLRQGTARAADRFDLVVAAPGSEITAMLAAVYLQPSDMPLLGGDIYAEIANDPRVAIAAPIAFGDSFEGAPVVGTTPQFVTHLGGTLADGRLFAAMGEAVAGANAPVNVGDEFSPAHGMTEPGHEDEAGHHDEASEAGDGDEEEDGHHVHEGVHYDVVGRMAPTGSPWDRAILVPVEAVWDVHGLATGHAPGWDGSVGPPFDPAYFAGTPAIMVRAEALWANYALKSEFSRDDAMAFFPGTVLSQLHGLLGDVRQAMSILAVVTEILVTAGVLAGPPRAGAALCAAARAPAGARGSGALRVRGDLVLCGGADRGGGGARRRVRLRRQRGAVADRDGADRHSGQRIARLARSPPRRRVREPHRHPRAPAGVRCDAARRGRRPSRLVDCAEMRRDGREGLRRIPRHRPGDDAHGCSVRGDEHRARIAGELVL